MQSATTDVTQSMSGSITNLFIDASQISTYSLYNCTRAYLNVLHTSYEVASEDVTIDYVLSALSSLLALGSRHSKEMIDEIIDVLAQIALNRQTHVAIGEGTSIAYDTIRFYSTKMRYCDAKRVEFVAALSDLEQFLAPTNLTIVTLHDENGTTPVVNPCGYQVGVSIILSILNLRMQGVLNNTKAAERSANKNNWDKESWVGYLNPDNKGYSWHDRTLEYNVQKQQDTYPWLDSRRDQDGFPFTDYDAQKQISNSSGFIFQFNAEAKANLPLPVLNISLRNARRIDYDIIDIIKGEVVCTPTDTGHGQGGGDGVGIVLDGVGGDGTGDGM